MSKILFISSNLSSSLHGGWQCSNRNLKSIEEICGKENVDVELLSPFSNKSNNILVILMNAIKALVRLLFTFRMNGMTKDIEDNIIQKIKNNEYKYVFIDSSLNGFLIKKIKKINNVLIFSFFHNCEYSFIKNQITTAFSIINLFRLYPCYCNEKNTLKYSDKVIVLNKRDLDLLNRIYSCNKMMEIIPISLDDRVSDENLLKHNTVNSKLTVLFIGSNFYANRMGITWFIKNVFPYVSIKLMIVGKDMDKLRFPTSEDIVVHSNVSSVDKYYIDSDVVVAPIFTGGGMKVKIAEALMFGKMVIGTEEALQGYESTSSIIKCEKAQEFINIINGSEAKSYREESRVLFLKNYSFSATLDKFIKLFDD